MSEQRTSIYGQPKEMKIFVTNSLGRQLMHDSKMEESTINNIVDMMGALQHFKGIERARQAHSLYEQLFPQYFETLKPNLPRPPICGKSCNACCYQYLGVCKEEAELIYDLALKTGIMPSVKTLRYQARFNNPNDYWSRFGKRTKCGFLHPEKGCLIYTNRPLSCRSLLSVEESSEMCKPNEDGRPRSVKYVFNYPSEIIISALLNLSLQERSTKDIRNHAEEGVNPIVSLPSRLLDLIGK